MSQEKLNFQEVANLVDAFLEGINTYESLEELLGLITAYRIFFSLGERVVLAIDSRDIYLLLKLDGLTQPVRGVVPDILYLEEYNDLGLRSLVNLVKKFNVDKLSLLYPQIQDFWESSGCLYSFLILGFLCVYNIKTENISALEVFKQLFTETDYDSINIVEILYNALLAKYLAGKDSELTENNINWKYDWKYKMNIAYVPTTNAKSERNIEVDVYLADKSSETVVFIETTFQSSHKEIVEHFKKKLYQSYFIFIDNLKKETTMEFKYFYIYFHGDDRYRNDKERIGFWNYKDVEYASLRNIYFVPVPVLSNDKVNMLYHITSLDKLIKYLGRCRDISCGNKIHRIFIESIREIKDRVIQHMNR